MLVQLVKRYSQCRIARKAPLSVIFGTGPEMLLACGDGQTDRQTHRRARPTYNSRRLRLARNVINRPTADGDWSVGGIAAGWSSYDIGSPPDAATVPTPATVGNRRRHGRLTRGRTALSWYLQYVYQRQRTYERCSSPLTGPPLAPPGRRWYSDVPCGVGKTQKPKPESKHFYFYSLVETMVFT